MNRFLARSIDRAVFATFHWTKLRRSHHLTDPVELMQYRQQLQFLSQDDFFHTGNSILFEEFNISDAYSGFRGAVRDFTLPTANAGPWPENNTVPGRVYECGSAACGVVVVLHGWLSFSYLGYRAICRKFNDWGLHGVFVELPHHMHRRSAGSIYSGEFALSGNVIRTVESFRQAVGDAHRLVRALRSFYHVPVGVWGISLGAWIGSMLCTLPQGPEAAVVVAPPADPHEMFLRSPLTALIRRDVESSGVALDAGDPWTGRLIPAGNPLSIPADRVMIVRPEEDQAIPPSIVEDLHRAWPGTAYRTYPHGHVSILACRRMLADAGEFLSGRLDAARTASAH